MGGQQDTCWRCGAQWATEVSPPTTLTLPRTVPAELPYAKAA
jgi:hypothetical protein